MRAVKQLNNFFLVVLLAAVFVLLLPQAADADNLSKWSGGDVVEQTNNNGTITLDQGVSKQAVLRVCCDSKNGYTLQINAPNATSESTGKLLLDGTGGDSTQELTYSAVLDITQFSGKSTVEIENLKLLSSADTLAVNFNARGNILPRNAGNSNHIKLFFTLDSFNELEKVAGSYTETIEATVTFR